MQVLFNFTWNLWRSPIVTYFLCLPQETLSLTRKRWYNMIYTWPSFLSISCYVWCSYNENSIAIFVFLSYLLHVVSNTWVIYIIEFNTVKDITSSLSGAKFQQRGIFNGIMLVYLSWPIYNVDVSTNEVYFCNLSQDFSVKSNVRCAPLL